VVLSFFFGVFFLNLKSKKNASCFRAATEKAKKEKRKKKKKRKKRKKKEKKQEKKKKRKKECRLWISRRKAKWLVVR
jgi:mannitol-specific phosphotransferase system IIBC component